MVLVWVALSAILAVANAHDDDPKKNNPTFLLPTDYQYEGVGALRNSFCLFLDQHTCIMPFHPTEVNVMNKITSVYVRLPPQSPSDEIGSSVAPINTLEFTIDNIRNHYEIHELLILLDLNAPKNGELPHHDALPITKFETFELKSTVFTFKKIIRGTSLGWHYKDVTVRYSEDKRCEEFIPIQADVRFCFEFDDHEPRDDGADPEDKEQGFLLDQATNDVFGVVFAFRVFEDTPTERKVLLGVTYLNRFIDEIKRLMEERHHELSDKVTLPPVLPLEYNTDEGASVFTGGSCVFVRWNICIMRKPVKSPSPIREIRIKKFETTAITDDFQSAQNIFEIHEALIFMRLREPQSGQMPFQEFRPLEMASDDVSDAIAYGPIKYFRSRTYTDDYAYIDVELLSKRQCNHILHYGGDNQHCFRLVDRNGKFNDHRDHFAEGVLLHPRTYLPYGVVTSYKVTMIGSSKHRTIAVHFWATLFGRPLILDIELLARDQHIKKDTITELVEIRLWWMDLLFCFP